ncbi:HNH endonuclease [Sulfurimonas crateris]|uniref:HNH endonuclease n=1 Tax=Sulfurimonas crateris TaxID=2574727 RepID=A0A4U2Z8V6_9BACT|nr:HNH endonuclease [Sulfurimonas crateris]TKI70385.1 HNH endonuclease [Sulfurimonas crateris]
MRIIPKPNISPVRAYVACYSSFANPVIQNNFKSIASFINTQSMLYDTNANNMNLYTFQPHVVVQGTISKNDMKTLYKNNMVQNKRGRKIYDKLLSLAPLSRCPYCGVGEVSTLDHYLPKAEFPIFSVLPHNLVASCKDCNTGKLASYATTQNTQTLHPYYDDFTTQQWLYARVLQTSPVSIEFYVNPHATWNQVDKDRVKEHFVNYKLYGRFAMQAANVLADLREEFILYNSTPLDIQQELQKKARSYESRYKNSWETAMYQALYQDQWYYNGGYQ